MPAVIHPPRQWAFGGPYSTTVRTGRRLVRRDAMYDATPCTTRRHVRRDGPYDATAPQVTN
ncbi:hypothetical protein ACFTY8_44195, partial [Streptomyces mirabilis]|uniref:hypothetical protein n=1 Tax=Streptomyces mirabilis TaxID=68239 RepID=UPI0036293EA9